MSVERVSVESLIPRIERAASELGGGALAFDGDGTLWDGDIGEDFFFELVRHGDVRPQARAQLAAEAQAHGLESGGAGVELASRLFEAYRGGLYPERATCEMIAWLCAGWSHGEVARFAEAVVVTHRLAERLHPETHRIARHARSLGLRTLIVSASPLPVVDAAAKIAGFSETVAAAPRFDGEHMLAAVDRPIPYDEGKVSRLRERIGTLPLLAAFGDNTFDVPMLGAAHLAVAVRPKPRLLARVADVPGLLLLSADDPRRIA